LGHQVSNQEALGDSRDPGSAQNTRYAEASELQLLHRWLDTWAGIGLIAVGLHSQGWDLQLTQYGDGNWRAAFYVTGVAHSIRAEQWMTEQRTQTAEP